MREKIIHISTTVLITVIFLIVFNCKVFANNIFNSDNNFHTNYNFHSNNKIDFGLSKELNNVWGFFGSAFYGFNSDWGSFQILNNYQGTAIIDAYSNSFRDDETFFIAFNYLISKNIFITTEANYNFTADKRVQEANQLKRISGVSGVSGKLLEMLDFNVLFGVEDNTQANIDSTGFLTKTNARIKNLDIDGYAFNSSLNSELLFLKDKRSSKDVEFLADIHKIFSQKEMFQFAVKYKLQGRDFLQFAGANNPFAIETNLDNRIGGILIGSWEVIKNYVLNFAGEVENISIKRDFMNNYEHINFSKVIRNYNEINTNLQVVLDIFGKNNFQKIGIIRTDKNERNSMKKHFDIDDNTFLIMQGNEAQKDNNSQIINLFYNSSINISKKDTIKTNLSIIKLEYNTPSVANNDARDEAKIISSLWYLRKSSDILSFIVNLNYSQNHLVFIKKERSIQNNWNRIIALNTGIIIHSEDLYYAPQFEVLANYTIYDFESSNNQPRSYSFRQVAYKDSLQLKLNEKYYFTNRINFRLFEKGILFWTSFAELPQQRSIEIATFPMLNCEMNKNIKVGLGGRLFFLNYGAISTVQSTQNAHKIYTISPEASYSIRFNRVTLNCFGWLEFRYQQDKFIGRNPNIFLQTTYNF